MCSATPFSFLTDDEYLQHLYNVDDPSAEHIESALRIELLLEAYRSALEAIHKLAVAGLDASRDTGEVLTEIQTMTAPVEVVPVYMQ